MERIAKLAAWFVLLHGWQRLLTAFALGLASALAMPPLYLFPVLFFTLAGFAWIIDSAYSDARTGFFGQLRSAFAPGWWFGFGYFLAGLWWIGNAFLVEAEDFAWAMPFAVILLPALLAVFWGIASVIARLFWSDHWGRVFALAAGFGAAEYLRGTLLTGFPWNALGYAIMPHPLLMQGAAVLGLYGMSIVAVLVFALPLVALSTARGGKPWPKLPVVLAVVLVAVQAGYGAFRLATAPQAGDGPTIRIMQPAIEQRDKLAAGNELSVVETYLRVSAMAPDGGEGSLEGIDYLIWPESAFPFLLTEQPDVIAAIADLLPEGTTLITGALRTEPGAAGNPQGHVYNSIYVIDSHGEILEAADKTHLVPFGEYLPFQNLLETYGFEQLTRLPGGFEAGAQRSLLLSDSRYPVLPLICYEIIFSGALRDGVSAAATKPGWIVNLTNDAWFGRTPGPYQHFQQARLRGIEEGLAVVRVANTGISAAADAYGNVLRILPLGVQGTADFTLPPATGETLFSRFGHQPFGGLLIACMAIALIARRRALT